jgi:hypothetical protein
MVGGVACKPGLGSDGANSGNCMRLKPFPRPGFGRARWLNIALPLREWPGRLLVLISIAITRNCFLFPVHLSLALPFLVYSPWHSEPVACCLSRTNRCHRRGHCLCPCRGPSRHDSFDMCDIGVREKATHASLMDFLAHPSEP